MTENVNPFLSARDETARAAEDTLGGYTSDSSDELDALELEEEQINPTNHRSGANEQGSGGTRVPPMMMGGGSGAQAGSARAVAGTTQQTGMTAEAAAATGAAGLAGKAGPLTGGAAIGAAGAGAAKMANDSKNGAPKTGGAGVVGPIPGIVPGYSGGTYAPNVGGTLAAGQIPGFNAPAGTAISGVGGTMAANELQGSGWRHSVNGSFTNNVTPAGFGNGVGATGWPSGSFNNSVTPAGFGNGVGATGWRSGSPYSLGEQRGLDGFQSGPTRTPTQGGVTATSGGTNEALSPRTGDPAARTSDSSTTSGAHYGQHTGAVQGTSYSNSGTNTGIGASGNSGGSNGAGTSSSSNLQMDVNTSKVIDQASAWDKWSADLQAIRSRIDATRASTSDFGNISDAAASYQGTQTRLGSVTDKGTTEFTDFSAALQDTAEKFEEGDQQSAEVAAQAMK